MNKRQWILLIGLVFLLSACADMTPTPTDEMAEIAFEPKLTMFESGRVSFKLGIANTSGPDQPMVDDVNIRAVVTNEEGGIRNQMTIVDLPSIPAGETKSPLTYEAVYEPGQYVMSITGEGIPSLSFSFEVREEDGILKLAAHPQFIDPHTGFTIDDSDL
jgi:hypothetical protein